VQPGGERRQIQTFKGEIMQFKPRSITLLSAVLLGASALSSLAYAESFEREIEYRQSVMEIFGWNMKAMGAMLKGKVPYDAASFARHASDMQAATSLDLLSGFPEDSNEGETDALPDIWLDFNDFKQKYADLQAASKTLNTAAAGSDQAQIKAAFGDLGKACKACHRAYKE
jgi:cytochrome c556